MKICIVARCKNCHEDGFKDALDYQKMSCWNCNRIINWWEFKKQEIADITSETGVREVKKTKRGWMGLDSQGNENGP